MHDTTKLEEIEVQCWSEFEVEIQKIDQLRAEQRDHRRLHEPLFRGVGKGNWGLETTLDRSYSRGERSAETMSLRKYYKIIDRTKPAVESLTGRQWSRIPNWREFEESMAQDRATWLDMFLSDKPEIYEYLIYLRHHGFPSPLLDWTASPYVAVFFAFDSMDASATHVCVYALLQDSMHSLSGDAHFFVVGRYVNTHPRHYLQQSRYSLCVSLKVSETEGIDYMFCPHELGLLQGGSGPNGRLFKIKFPAKERRSILQRLDLMNINPHSLYGSEDALIRTVARRECLFQSWD